MAKQAYGDQKLVGKLGFTSLDPLPSERILGSVSYGDITLAVETTGNDNDIDRPAQIVSGDWTDHPFATIQAAVNSLPKMIIHSFYINVGPGEFDGFDFFGFVLSGYDERIRGTRETFTPATGPSSGTATSGGAGTLTLTGAGWTASDLAGKFLRTTAGFHAGFIIPIRSNTTDTIVMAYDVTFDETTQFVIEDITTLIITPTDYEWACVTVSTVTAQYLTIKDLRVSPDPGDDAIGFVAEYCNEVGFVQCIAENCSDGFELDSSNGYCGWCIAAEVSSCGFWTSRASRASFTGCWAPNSGYAGLYVQYCVDLFVYSFYTEGCGSSGITLFGIEIAQMGYPYGYPVCVDSCPIGIWAEDVFIRLGDADVSNSGTISFDLRNCQIYHRGGTLSGTGNAGFGLKVKGMGNLVELASTETIDGASGEVSVDGVTDVTWAALDTSGDYAVDTVTGARVARL